MTVEAWARDYVTTCHLVKKLAPPPRPRAWSETTTPLRIDAPGRPPELRAAERRPKTPSAAAMRDPRVRARLLHTFVHHELQAAELMAWALLAFPETPRAFRQGLLVVLDDEVRHMKMYGEAMARLGYAYGDFEVNDWFWRRVPLARSPAEFVATMGIGFEGGNLDHAPRFASRLRAAGDDFAAEIELQVGEEEIPHVRFAVHWFGVFTGGLSFDAWRAHLVLPLTPTVMRASPVAREARRRAGLDDAFVDRLDAWSPGS